MIDSRKQSRWLGYVTVAASFFSFLMSHQGFAHETNDKQMAADVLVYVNQYRVQHGLPKLVMNQALSKEAFQHSAEMASHAIPFGHVGFDKRIQHLHQVVPHSLSGAENVAYNYKTAQIVVDGWIKSSGHRRNIVGHYNLTGIGIARDKQGKIYYTQIFLKANEVAAAHRSLPVTIGTRHHA